MLSPLRSNARLTVVLFDFLAPSLVRQSSSNAARKNFARRLYHFQRRHAGPGNNLLDIDPRPFDCLDKSYQKSFQRIDDHNAPKSSKTTDILDSVLLGLNQSLRNCDLESIIRHWQTLEEHGLIPLLSPHTVKHISQLIHDTILSQTLHEALPRGIEDVALGTAVSYSPDALAAVMVHHIRSEDPDAVLSLYERFKASLVEQGVWEDSFPERQELDNDLASVHETSLRRLLVPTSRVLVLLAATTALAMRDDFVGAVRLYLQTSVHFQSHATVKFFPLLEHDIRLQEKVEAYVQRLRLARHLSQPSLFDAHILKLGRKLAFNRLQTLYDEVVDGISGPDAFITTSPESITDSKPVSINPSAFSAFLTAFYHLKNPALVKQVWQTLPSLGIPYDVSMWTALMDASARTWFYEDAIAAWDTMISCGIQPTALSYKALIAAYFQGKQEQLAMTQIRTLKVAWKQHGFPLDEVHQAYNTVIRGLLHCRQGPRAHAFLDIMMTDGLAPNLETYNAFLGYYARQKNMQGISSIMDRMSREGVKGDIFTYSTVLSSLIATGRTNAMDLVLRIMEAQGIAPTVATYTAIIAHQLEQTDQENLKAAMDTLERMESNPLLHPPTTTYITFLKGIHRRKDITPGKVEQFTAFVLRRMQERNLKLGSRDYTSLIQLWLDGRHPEGAQKAVELYNNMGGDAPVLFHTWYVLLNGLMAKNAWDLADVVVNDMKRKNGEPHDTMKYLVDQISKRKRGKTLRGL